MPARDDADPSTTLTYRSNFRAHRGDREDGQATIGQFLNQITDFQTRAAYFADKMTRLYLDAHLDEAAKDILQEIAQSNSISDFYKAFFTKHAVAVGTTQPLAFNCINPYACTIFLVRKLSER